ncbi:hypothetical protein HNY73_021088 [Argiope bruennichi]|uniref:Uncharacterized protein n=1 Tax=Argiope bruennichi TaxID=94029 RepID=A0A8T0E9X9_ARGBR|nr:hypothetical protein HNY73_021088 [Argiope bruennichi]
MPIRRIEVHGDMRSITLYMGADVIGHLRLEPAFDSPVRIKYARFIICREHKKRIQEIGCHRTSLQVTTPEVATREPQCIDAIYWNNDTASCPVCKGLLFQLHAHLNDGGNR